VRVCKYIFVIFSILVTNTATNNIMMDGHGGNIKDRPVYGNPKSRLFIDKLQNVSVRFVYSVISMRIVITMITVITDLPFPRHRSN